MTRPSTRHAPPARQALEHGLVDRLAPGRGGPFPTPGAR